MSQTSHQPPAGWYPDPAGSGDERYWDGGTWSQVTRPTGGLHAPAQPAQPQTHGQQPTQGYGYLSEAATSFGLPRLAGWWQRVLAAVLDYLIFFIPAAVILSTMPFMQDLQAYYTEVFIAASQGAVVVPEIPQSALDGLTAFSVVMAVVWFGYRAVMVALKGATFGQMALGLRVVPDGAGVAARVGWGQSFARAALAVLTWQVPLVGPLVFALVSLFTPKRQALHDLIAKTVVVRKK